MDKKFAIKFVSYWVVNSLVLALSNSFFPDYYVLGNAYLSIPSAVIFSGFLLTILLLLAKGLAKTRSFSIKGRVFMYLYYAAAASAGIWLVARIANVSGFGIARFTWAIAAGLVVSFANWLLRQAFKGMKIVDKK
jgi:uncharacterized membrane protein YvlD (DUF360 family)